MCTHNCIIPVTLLNSEGRPVSGTVDAPRVPIRQLPALLGLHGARESGIIIGTTQNAIYMAGLGVYDLVQALPPRTQQCNCMLAPSGHTMIPCAEFPMKQDATHRGVLGLTPELALPVEFILDNPPREQEPSQRTRARAGQHESV